MDNEYKILDYLNFRIEDLEKQHKENVNLDDRCISKEKLIESTQKALNELKNIKSMIEKGLIV